MALAQVGDQFDKKAYAPGADGRIDFLAPRYFAWVNLNRKFSMSFVPSVVSCYSLTQPQCYRGTEAIFSAGPHPHNSAKSQIYFI